MHYLIKDTEFEKIMKFLFQIKGIHKKNVNRLRNFIEAVYYVCRSGCQWRLLPSYYGNWRAIHKRFKYWSERNIWKKLFEIIIQENPDTELTMIDSTIVRAHACAAGYTKYTQPHEALGRSKGGFSTKIHAIVDALGNPLKFILTPGQRNDITQAKFLTASLFEHSYLLILLMIVMILLKVLMLKAVYPAFLLKKIENTLEIMINIFIKNEI